ncbi:hypothetical protein EYF80_044823 [Liparis tanakae]|uniref:Uncharacterized protein n=1 Tax=Liparis tanakae TaxID=230148 RepID=A0A4Z2FUW9_9TELE|nr:hypothetical protein EYF80_044823 [Liparis tanakae]
MPDLALAQRVCFHCGGKKKKNTWASPHCGRWRSDHSPTRPLGSRSSPLGGAKYNNNPSSGRTALARHSASLRCVGIRRFSPRTRPTEPPTLCEPSESSGARRALTKHRLSHHFQS